MKYRKLYILLLVCCMSLVTETIFSQGLGRLFNRGNTKKGAKGLSKMKDGSDDPADYILRPQYKVIADEPLWLLKKNSYENFYYNLLTGSIIGNYDLNLLTGNPRNKEELDWISSRQEASKSGDSVNIYQYLIQQNRDIDLYFQVSSYGDVGGGFSNQAIYYGFLTNNHNVQDTLIDRIRIFRRDIIKKYKIEESQFGLILDIQNIPAQLTSPEDIQNFKTFIEKIKKKLFPGSEGAKLGIKLPIIHEENNFYYVGNELLKRIIPMFDLVIYKNYSRDLEEINDEQLQWFVKGNYNFLKFDVDSLQKLGIPLSKLIVEFAYLGLNLKRDSTIDKLVFDRMNPIVSYDNMNKMADRSFVKESANETDSSMTKFKFKNGNEFHYDDEHIRLFKYDRLKSLGILGISLHGIGYNNIEKGTKYWKAIADVFGRIPDKLIWYFFGTLLGFLSFGFPYSVIKFWQARNILAKYKKYLLHTLGGWLIATFGFLFCLNIIPRNTVGVYVGLGILGILIIMILARVYLSKLISLFRK